MAYAAFANVQNRIARHVLTTSTPVKIVTVEEFIDDVDAEINSLLFKLRYSIPVTEPEWFVTRLRSLSADGAAAITLKSLFPEATGPGGSPAYAFYEERYRDGLKAIEGGAHPRSSNVETAATWFTEHPDLDTTLFKVQEQY